MYFSLKCPKCDKTLKVREELAGRKAGCPYCQEAFVVPRPKPREEPKKQPAAPSPAGQLDIKTRLADTRQKGTASGAAAKVAQSTASASSSSAAYDNGTDVSMLRSGLVALGFSVAFLLFTYVLKLGLPKNLQKFSDLFLDRGWVPFVMVGMMSWSMAILMMKSRKLTKQRSCLLFDLLPTELSETISIDTAEQFERHVRGLPAGHGSSFLINRVLTGLEHFRVRKSAPEVATILSSQSEIDANAVDSSYTMLKVFIWAIPILGFIGTVIGISAAVGGFSGNLDAAGDVSALKESLNSVTGGLSTAFDTTLVALIMSIFVMFPTSSMQKAEEDVLNWVDEYCNENLLKRLDDGREGGATRSQLSSNADVQRAVDSAMSKHQAEFAVWTQKLEAVGETLTDKVSRGWSNINERLLAQVNEHHQHKSVELEQLNEMSRQFQETLQQLQQQTGQIHEQVAGSMSQSADSLQSYFQQLERGLTTLGDTLEKLGERNVVVQVEQKPKKRGWFGR